MVHVVDVLVIIAWRSVAVTIQGVRRVFLGNARGIAYLRIFRGAETVMSGNRARAGEELVSTSRRLDLRPGEQFHVHRIDLPFFSFSFLVAFL